MKRTVLALTILAASSIFSPASYAQGAHDHGTPKSGQGADQGHDAHCCKPDPANQKGTVGMSEHKHDHSQAAKKPATRKSERKPAGNAGQNAK